MSGRSSTAWSTARCSLFEDDADVARSAVSTGSSRASCGRSPTAACRGATGWRCTWPPRRTSSAAGSDELAGVVASHYLSALRSAPGRRRPGRARVADGRRARGGRDPVARPSAPTPARPATWRMRSTLADRRADPTAPARGTRRAPCPAAGRFDDAEAVAREVVEAGLARGEPDRAARAGTILDAGHHRQRPTGAMRSTEATAIRGRLGAGRRPRSGRHPADRGARPGPPDEWLATAAARELIDTILPVADRLGLREVVAELLPSRAGRSPPTADAWRRSRCSGARSCSPSGRGCSAPRCAAG